MAEDFSKEQWDELNKAVAEATKAFGGISPELAEKLTKAIKERLKKEMEFSAWAGKDNKTKKDQAEKQIAILKKLHDKYKDGVISLEQFNEESEDATWALQRLQKGLDATTRAASQSALQDVKNVEITRQAYATLAKSTFDLAKSLTSQAFSAYSGVLKGIQSGANGIQSSAAMMSADLDITNAGIQGMAGMATTAGSSMAMMGGRARIAGGALMVLGQAASLASSAFTALEKFKIEFYAKEIEKSFEGFKTLSSKGVMLGDGLMGLRNAAQGTGLAMSTLANIEKNNSEALSAAGLGATGGFKLMTKTFQEGGKTLKNSLLNLGYDFEEQGEIVAKTMEQIRRSGQDPNKADMQSATKDYATNLRLIADITGQDAKAKMEQAKKASTNMAVRAKLLKMQAAGDEQATARFQRNFALVPEAMKDAYLQKFATSDMQGRGGITTDVAANVMGANNPELLSGVDKLVQNTADSAASAKDSKEDASKIVGGIHKTFTSPEFANNMAPIGAATMLTGAMAGVTDKAMKGIDESLSGVKDGEEGKKAAVEIQAQLNTKSKEQLVLNDLIIKGEKNRLDLEIMAAGKIAEYTKLMGKAQDEILKLLNGVDHPVSTLIGKFGDLALGLLGVIGILPMLKGGLGFIGKALGLSKGAALATTAVSSTAGAATAATGAATAGAAASGAIKAPGGLSPAQLDKYKELRASGVSATDAKAQASKLSGIKGLAQAEGKIAGAAKGGVTAAETAVKAGGSTAAEAAAKGAVKAGAAKGIGKAILGKIPGVGLVLGLADAGYRITQGDYTGAALAAGAGAASTVPGLGTAASIALSGALIAKDMGAFDKALPTAGEIKENEPAGEKKPEAVEGKPAEEKKEKLDLTKMYPESMELGPKTTGVLSGIQSSLADAKAVQVTTSDYKNLFTSLDKVAGKPDVKFPNNLELGPRSFAALDKVASKPEFKFPTSVELNPTSTTVLNSIQQSLGNKDQALTTAMDKASVMQAQEFAKRMEPLGQAMMLQGNITSDAANAMMKSMPAGSSMDDLVKQLTMESPVKAQSDKMDGIFDNIQKFMKEALAPTPDVNLETDQKKANSQLLTEVRKMNELLTAQNTLAEQANQHRKQLLDVTEDHKRVSDRIFEATS